MRYREEENEESKVGDIRRNSCDETMHESLVGELAGGLAAAKRQREDATWRIEAFRARLAALGSSNQDEQHVYTEQEGSDSERFSSYPALVAFATNSELEQKRTSSHYYDLLQVASSSSPATRSALQRTTPLIEPSIVSTERRRPKFDGMPKQRRLLLPQYTTTKANTSTHTKSFKKKNSCSDLQAEDSYRETTKKKKSSYRIFTIVSILLVSFSLCIYKKKRKTANEKKQNSPIRLATDTKTDIFKIHQAHTMKKQQIPEEARVAFVSSNFGRVDQIPTAPRQRANNRQVSYFFFARQRNLLATLRGWTVVLPWRMRRYIASEINDEDGNTTKAHRRTNTGTMNKKMESSEVFSKSWNTALLAIDKGRRGGGHLKRERYPAYSRQLASLPFDLESLEHTRRHGIDSEYDQAQNLVDVMAPKFVKLQMFKIDILMPYTYLIWADSSLVFDDSAVNRAMRPLVKNDADLVVQPHPKRNSTLEEIRHILKVQSQPRFVAIHSYLRDQLAFYENATNFFDSHGLYWMAYFGAKRTNRSIDFFDRWWLEVRRWQYRDQVSVMYALTSVPEPIRPRIATFEANLSCCNKHRLAPEQVLCATLVGDFNRCCRRCSSARAPSPTSWLHLPFHHNQHHHHNHHQKNNHSSAKSAPSSSSSSLSDD